METARDQISAFIQSLEAYTCVEIPTKRTFAFIDAANLFYGGKKSLGWSVDYKKLYDYLRDRFGTSVVYYFGGIEIHKFPFDYLTNETVPLEDLEEYLTRCIEKSALTNSKLTLTLERYLKRVKFYKKLENFGYKLILKPVKIHRDSIGNQKRKANCDVEMAFYFMHTQHEFERVVVLSGDGDFLPILKHLRNTAKKEVLVMARGQRTAKEIRKFTGDKFMDFTDNLRKKLERTDP